MTETLTDTVDLVSDETVRLYVSMLFDDPDLAHGRFVCLRGIGEKGTDKEGVFRENLFYVAGPTLGDSVLKDVRRWSDHGIASYILPATLKSDDSGVDDNVNQFTTLVVDLDSGDTNKKRDHLAKALGFPTMIVSSGGITDTGNLKLHCYWRLTEPTSDKDLVGRLRERMAQRAGGDWQFKKPAQVIRIPGSVHAKSGKQSKVEIISYDKDVVYDLAKLERKIDQLGWMDGVKKPEAVTQEAMSFSAMMPGASAISNILDFSRGAGGETAGVGKAIDALSRPVHEGGDEDRNRWSEFSRVAGHHIHCVRLGQYDMDTAADLTRGWMAAMMVPPWPEARFQQEFRAVYQQDMRHHGPMPVPKIMPDAVPVQTLEGKILAPEAGLRQWDIGNWAVGPAPHRRFLVPGWIMCGVPHTLAAEGGAGKTYMALDLGLKLAAASRGTLGEVRWLGEPISDEALGGAVVIITAEDDQNELHIRLEELDRSGELRKAASGRLRVLPLVNAGGVFKLVRRSSSTGEPESSQKWDSLMAAMTEIKADVGKITAVIIDTLAATLHGEDISSQVVTEYYTEASRVCGELGSALIVTHHIRKQKASEPIKTGEEMAEAIRGSGAVQFSSRVVMGLWHAHDYETMMKAMKEQPEPRMCYRFGIVKGNNNELVKDPKVLLRVEGGYLVDKTTEISAGLAETEAERKAWLLLMIQMCCAKRIMLRNHTNKNGIHSWTGMFDNAVLSAISRDEMLGLIKTMEKERKITIMQQTGSTTGKYIVPYGHPPFEEEKKDSDGRPVTHSRSSFDMSRYTYDMTSETVIER